MNIWILDGDKMQVLWQQMQLKQMFATEKDKNKMALAIEVLDEIKGSAIKINDHYQDLLNEELGTIKKRK